MHDVGIIGRGSSFVSQPEASYFLLSFGEVGSCLGRVWYDAPGNNRDDDRGEAFNEEE